MFPLLFRFALDDRGAVTVDWVVLTAVIAGLGIATITALTSGTGDLASNVETALSEAEVPTLGDVGAAR